MRIRSLIRLARKAKRIVTRDTLRRKISVCGSIAATPTFSANAWKGQCGVGTTACEGCLIQVLLIHLIQTGVPISENRKEAVVFNTATFHKEINELVRHGQATEAEERMLRAYSELKAANNTPDLEAVVARLAHFYSMPETEDLQKAESYFLEREGLAPGAYAKYQTATFYFYILGSSAKTVKKIDEIKTLKTVDDRASLYSSLALLGQALLKLDQAADAGKVLQEILSLIRMNPSGLPYGDEINLLQAAISNPTLAPRCREILDLIIPKLRSQEYIEKAKDLLKSA